MKKIILYSLLSLALFGLPFIAYTSEEYVGAAKCKVCHIKIFKSWSETKHATAFDVLRPGVQADVKKRAGLDPGKDYTNDSSCIQCHTTGNTTMFPGVQCEACHGPGKNYSNVAIMNKSKWNTDPEGQRKCAIAAGLIVHPEEKTCTACHNEKSPTYTPFDFKARYNQVKHPQQ
ncbi:MAG: cytochrome c family protein [Desulfobacterota bacterium]|nr:cytochrome c family protein [Thermodesulfobacteriota bacterium]